MNPDHEMENIAPKVFWEPNQPHSAGKALFASGLARVVISSTGETNCFALLLTKELVTAVLNIQNSIITTEELQEVSSVVKRGSDTAESSIKATLDNFAEKELPNEENRKPRSSLSERKANIAEAMSRRNQTASAAHQELFSITMDSLIKANLVKRAGEKVDDRIERVADVLGDASPIRVFDENGEELFEGSAITTFSEDQDNQDQVILKELRNAEYEFYELDKGFDNRENFYDEKLAQFLERADPSKTKSDFNRHWVVYISEMSRKLTAAERNWEQAIKRAKDLGLIPGNGTYQSSHFVDDVDDGYADSAFEVEMTEAKRQRVYTWVDKIDPSRDLKTLIMDAQKDGSPWEPDTLSLAPSDSVSIRASGKLRQKIDRWRKVCEALSVDVPVSGGTSTKEVPPTKGKWSTKIQRWLAGEHPIGTPNKGKWSEAIRSWYRVCEKATSFMGY